MFCGIFVEEKSLQLLKIDSITRDPPHDSDKNYSPVAGFVWARCLLDQKMRQKRKDWWSKFLANTAAVGSVKQIPRCPEKSINVTNWTRISQSRSDRWTDPRTLRYLKSRTFSEAVTTSRSEYFTAKRITKKPICCSSWSSREDWSTDLCQKFPSSSSRAALSNEYDRTGGEH